MKHGGAFEMFWSGLCAVAVLAWSLVMPYRVLSGTMPLDGIYWLLVALFMADAGIAFNTPVMIGMETVADRRRVARRYLAGWFAPDLVAALPLAALARIGAGGLFPGAGVHQALLLLPLVKVFKLPRFSRTLRQGARVPPGLMRIGVFVFWFVMLAHFVALGWIALGAVEAQRPFGDRYIRALYWCITTITTIGYGDYGPDHESNRQIIYTIAVQLMGAGLFSYIVGNVATLIVNLDAAGAEFRGRLEDIRAAMRVKRIPADIQERVNRYYRYLWETRRGIPDERVMRDLPGELRMEIALYLNRGMLEKVAFFRDADEGLIRAVVGKLEPMVFLPGDCILRQGEFGLCMYFLSAGEVEVLVDGVPVARLREGAAFGETSLLQGERRNATVRSLAYCDVYRLGKEDFDRLREEFPPFDARMREIMRQRATATGDGASSTS